MKKSSVKVFAYIEVPEPLLSQNLKYAAENEQLIYTNDERQHDIEIIFSSYCKTFCYYTERVITIF